MEPLRCKKCADEFLTSQILEEHITEVHAFVCKICNQKFLYNSALKNHRINSHATEFQCTWKGKPNSILIFVDPKETKTFTVVDTGYKCHRCNEDHFKFPIEFQRHTRTCKSRKTWNNHQLHHQPTHEAHNGIFF